jgi:hypothetical protein
MHSAINNGTIVGKLVKTSIVNGILHIAIKSGGDETSTKSEMHFIESDKVNDQSLIKVPRGTLIAASCHFEGRKRDVNGKFCYEAYVVLDNFKVL